MTEKHFIVPDIKTVTIVGVGGTGGYLAQGLAKMMAGYRLDLDVTFVDPDTVEEKNRFRQNFMPWEIGQSKSESLAFRLNQQFGLGIKSFVGKGEDFYQGNTGFRDLLITCVDKIEPRKNLRNHRLWLDSGNDLDFGQVIFGTTHEKKQLTKQLKAWDKSPNIESLPNAYRKAQMWKIKAPQTATASCADHPFTEQGCFINEIAAQAALMILHQILVVGSVTTPAIYFNATNARMLPAKINQSYIDC